ncbi:MAG: hypothetical protein PHI35_03645 [Victivallaceae bacterium]|nr:hypothetical protein [Victivallaceae bacterium]
MKKHNFTLVELMVAIGIIVILAALLLPAVMKGQEKARITNAKSDMASIITALKQVDATYNKMMNPGVSYMPSVSGSNNFIRIDGDTAESAYNKFIMELTNPTYSKSDKFDMNINKRKIRFLDPRTEYNPEQTIANNANNLWRDPWGNPYVVIFNSDYTDQITDPRDNSKKLSAKVIIYSFGPNGQDNNGKNAVDDIGSPDKNDDDVCSWIQ